ncbi:MAG: glycosyltransferase, partial [Methylobacterium sp.]
MSLAALLRRVRRRRIAAIARRLFDPDFYARAYPDVARSSTDGFTHYMTHGWREGRDPSPHFTTLYYRDRHLAGRCINPLIHYASLGALLRLSTRPKSAAAYVSLQASLVRRHFSETYYRGLHPDTPDDDPLRHYLSVGWQDGRSGSPAFDPRAYLARHPHVATLGVSAHYHFASQMRLEALGPGRNGGRAWRSYEARTPRAARIRARIAREFDRAYYLRTNADIRERGIDPLTHYLTAGWRENRSPNRWFDAAYYLQNNPGAALTDVPPFYHFLLLGRRRSARPNPVGKRLYPPLRAPPAEAWGDVVPAADAGSATCIVLMPVHGGYHETLAAVHAVLAARQATRFALHVIDDCTPDADLAAALAAHAAAGLFVYEANRVNRGFVATVNAGLSRYPDRDVVLLNADTRVFGNWLDRILAHARRDPSIATITPLSNNATIASYPLRDVNNVIEMESDAEGLDALAAACNAGRTSEMLVGVGFCLFISAASRAVLGLLDTETFGRGYGEENDFCLRAAAAGFRNVLAEDVFVYHVGEVSFATVADDWRSHGENALLAKHPDYPLKLVRFLAFDPAEESRIRLDLMRLA